MYYWCSSPPPGFSCRREPLCLCFMEPQQLIPPQFFFFFSPEQKMSCGLLYLLIFTGDSIWRSHTKMLSLIPYCVESNMYFFAVISVFYCIFPFHLPSFREKKSKLCLPSAYFLAQLLNPWHLATVVPSKVWRCAFGPNNGHCNKILWLVYWAVITQTHLFLLFQACTHTSWEYNLFALWFLVYFSFLTFWVFGVLVAEWWI